MPKTAAPTRRRVKNRDAINALEILLTVAREDQTRIREELSRVANLAEHNNAVITTYEHRLQALAPSETEAQAG